MNNHKRWAIVYTIAKQISNKNIASVYSYADSKHFMFSGSVDNNRVNIFDYQRSCYLNWTMPSLFDFWSSNHVKLEINWNKFSGFDYETSSHFSWNINNNSISFYDYEFSEHFNYSF